MKKENLVGQQDKQIQSKDSDGLKKEVTDSENLAEAIESLIYRLKELGPLSENR